MDAFDTFWRWANKPLDGQAITIPAELHHAVTLLPETDWHDREKVNAEEIDPLTGKPVGVMRRAAL